MERFVFVAAIFVAILFAMGAMFGHGGGWRFEFDEAHGRAAPMMEVAPGQMAAQAYANAPIRIRHAAARIVVIPEDRTDVSVEIDNPGAAPMPLVSRDESEGVLVIDGQLRGRIRDCRTDGVDLRGYGEVPRERMPLVTIRTPRTLDISLHKASFTEIGATETLTLVQRGCGQTRAGDVAGEATVSLDGSGDLTVGASRVLHASLDGSGDLVTGPVAEAAEADVNGSGDLRTGAVGGGADISLDGSGTIEMASVTGAVVIRSDGSGDVVVRGGAITTADIDIEGSGDVEVATSVHSLVAELGGSGDILVTGDVTGALQANIEGSGSIVARGAVGSVDAVIDGSGDVRVGSVAAAPSQRVTGSGHVIVGD